MGFNHAADLGHNQGLTNALTVAYTLGASSNLLLVALFGDNIMMTRSDHPPSLDLNPMSGQQRAGNDDVAVVRWGTQNLTLGVKTVVPPELEVQTGDRYLYIYYLENPTPGTQNILIQCLSQHYIAAVAADYTDAKLTDIHTTTQNYAVDGAPFLTTDLSTSVDDCEIILLENAYADQGDDGLGIPATSPDAARRIFGVDFGQPCLFDANGPVQAGTHSITTERPLVQNSNITHIALAFEYVGEQPQPIAVNFDPTEHALQTVGTLAVRVFPRPIGVSLDPATFPRVEVSSGD